MKQKSLQTVLLLLLSVIWLFPFQLQPREWGMLAGAAVSYLCLLWIPQRVAAFAAAAAVSLGMSVYSGMYFACFAPGAAACAVFVAAAGSAEKVPAAKDGFLLFTGAVAALSAVGSVLYVCFAMRYASFQLPAFSRHTVFAAAAVLLIAALFAVSLRRPAQTGVPRKQPPSAGLQKYAVAFACMLLCVAAAGTLCLKQSGQAALCLYPVFLCAFTALALPDAAVSLLLRRKA